ncbi:Hsp70 family protein [Terribacillus saccharophilus]|uniref:Hsp70 family protein n=1 Tax=Terribacillus saccharophilus TaxID=361277 RepID=UPI002989E21D|nr:Hsp70 family protein [Terribacillus saccharophilus]MCM3226322.1 Hsp70 family protein [Terribacillus saccharophilus]
MYYGIDLGTTNSVISYGIEIASKDFFELQTITNQHGDVYTPSVIFFDEGEEPLVGKFALESYKSEPFKTVRWVKRKMGIDYNYKFGDREYNPQVMSAFILNELKSYAEKGNIEDSIDKVVITVPADFDNSAKQATIDAARIAGFSEVHLIPEPNAAILNYIYKTVERNEINEYFSIQEKYMLVFDLGGGTFDLSLSAISVNEEGQLLTRVITSSGNKYLGGINFDNDLLIYVLKKAMKLYPKDIEPINELLIAAEEGSEDEDILNALAQLLRDCEACKEYLSQNKKRTISFFSHQRKPYKVEINKSEFERLLKPYLTKIEECVEDVLKQAMDSIVNFGGWDRLEGVLLVGGSTHIPAIRDYCKETFETELIIGQEVYTSVSRGAAIYASILYGKNAFIKEYNTVVPHDFYIRNNKNYYSIFEKGTTTKQKNLNYEIPFALDTKAPIEIIQKYYNETGDEIDVLLQTINYSHPFMFTGDTLEMNFELNEDLIMSVTAREDCIDDYVEVLIENKSRLTEDEINFEKSKIFDGDE